MRFWKMPILIASSAGLVIFGLLVIYRWINPGSYTLTNDSIIDTVRERSLSTPTPFFLQEITIPALRSRAYNSKLNDLKKYEEKTMYTSYLTSYNSDGFKVNGLLTIPKSVRGEGKFPAIVFVHGYIAPTIYKTTERYNSYVDYFAESGFVVFKIDLRGHGDSEGEASGAYYSSDYVVDTLNAYSALQKAEFVDSNRIGLWGHSMAGNVTFRAFVVKQNIPALVVWAGAGYTYSDLLEYRLNDQSYRPPDLNSERARQRQAMRDAYGDFDSSHWFWRQVVPTNYLNGLTGAVELHHAQDDNVVSIEYSRNLVNILKKSNIKHELYEYVSGGHNIEGGSFTKAMQKTVEFYRSYLN